MRRRPFSSTLSDHQLRVQVRTFLASLSLFAAANHHNGEIGLSLLPKSAYNFALPQNGVVAVQQ